MSIPCERCGSENTDACLYGTGQQECLSCGYVFDIPHDRPRPSKGWQNCPRCGGEGYTEDGTCRYCGGTGQTFKGEPLHA